jgi:predicted alpha/beta superfamily hydrolase
MIHVRTAEQLAVIVLLQLIAGLAFLVGLSLFALFDLSRNSLPAARKAIKPALLWVNAWRYKRAEDEIECLAWLRLRLGAGEHQQRVRQRQRKLQGQRERINKW